MRITKENLTRYNQHFKSWQRRRLGYGNALENWHQTEEAGAVAFYPVGGSPLEGKVKFSFKETPPASGDKSPSNPSTIEGVSNVNIKRFGKNCCILQPARAGGSVSYTVNQDNTIRVYGTIPSSIVGDCINLFASNALYSNNYIKRGEQYTATFESTDSKMRLAIYSHTGSSYSLLKDIYPGESKNFIIPIDSDNYTWIRIWCDRKNNADTEYDGICKVQIELGSQATEMELPAVVDSYDIPLGSTYYGGEIDLATGLMTVTHYCWVWNNMNFGNPESYNSETGYAHFNYYSRPQIAAKDFPNNANVDGYYSCSHFPTKSVSSYLAVSNGTVNYPNIWFIPDGTQLRVTAPFQTKEAFNTWINEQYTAGTPVTLVYKLETPETVQLDPVTLTALAQTSRHEPRLNTVYTDADSIQITYQKSPIRAATEQEMAILGLGGNV